MSHRYVVFGAGRQGTAALHDLVVHCEAGEVLAVDPDAQRLSAARARLAKLLGPRAKVLRFAADASASDLRRADVVLSCAPYAVNPKLTARALAAGVAFCDLGGNPETVAEQENLARRASVPVVPDCGVSPGLSNVLAVHCARVHGCDEITVRCGGLPLVAPDAVANPLRYKLVFSPMGLISEYSGDVPVLRDGRASSVPALSSIESFEPGLECSPTSNNSPQVVAYLREIGVARYDYATVRYDGHFELVRGWKSLGFLRGDAARDRELAAWLERDPALRYDPRSDRDRLILRVRGAHSGAPALSRSKNSSRAAKTAEGLPVDHGDPRGASGLLRRAFEYRLDVPADRRTRFSAMELTTCWGITIVAHHMASGRGRPEGFATPERFVDTAWVISELERRLARVAT